jgi:transcriptional regulator
MYQPSHGKFVVPDEAEMLAGLCARVPATLVTYGPDGFRATILPLLFDAPGGTLRGHLARGNPHWRELAADGTAIAIFNGPDAYISPTWYPEKSLNGKVVPTWNYTTVVAHGRVTVHDQPEWLLAHVRELVDRHEASLPAPWSVDDPPEGYVETQVRAIVGIELAISRIDAKRKLSQNRSDADIAGVIAALENGTPAQRAVAGEMTRNEERRHSG